MQKRKYVEVKTSEKLPAEKGEYIAVVDPETNFAGFFYFDPEDPADVEWWKETPEYWLQEVPDYEDEMKEMLEKAKKVLIHYSKNLKTTDPTISEIEELLTKLKTES